MARYSYEIGPTEVGMVNVETLNGGLCPAPMGMAVSPYSAFYTTVDGTEHGDGFAHCEWRFSRLSKADWAALIDVYCPTQTGNVYINTRGASGTYTTYSAKMHRPKQGTECRWAINSWRDVVIRFTMLVAA